MISNIATQKIVKAWLYLVLLNTALITPAFSQEENEDIVVPDVFTQNEKKQDFGVAGEHIDIRTGSHYWEITDLTISGTAGLDINVNRSWNKSPRSINRLLGNWEIEIPRIEMTGKPDGTPGGDSSSISFCDTPKSKVRHTNVSYECKYEPVREYVCEDQQYWVPGYYETQRVYVSGYYESQWVWNPDKGTYGGYEYVSVYVPGGFQNQQVWVPGRSETRQVCGYETNMVIVCGNVYRSLEVDYFTGLTLLIPGQSPKPLLFKNNGNSFPSSAKYITTDNWLGRCDTNESGDRYFKVNAPDGKEYRMDVLGIERTTSGPGFDNWRGSQSKIPAEITAYASQVKDKFGNTINYNYSTFTSNTGRWGDSVTRPRVDSITSSDNRTVSFEYTNDTIPKIDKIVANNEEWLYKYTNGNNYLDSVIRPDNAQWEYQYQGPAYLSGWPVKEGADYRKDRRYLSQVKTPESMYIDYSYDTRINHYFDFSNSSSTDGNRQVLLTRSVQGQGIESFNTGFDFTKENSRNITTITGDRSEVYEFSRQSSLLGAPLKTVIMDDSGQEIQSAQFTWAPGPKLGEVGVEEQNTAGSEYQRNLTEQSISRPETPVTFVTQFTNHDSYGFPREITESGDQRRYKQISYFNQNTYDQNGLWIVGATKDEIYGSRTSGSNPSYTPLGSINREYNTNGTLREVTEFGITKAYTYHAGGNLHTESYRQNDNGPLFSNTYTNYKLGRPQNEQKPEGITISRIVDDWGNVISETDGEGNTITSTYDALGRIKSKNEPGQLPISYRWPTPTRLITSQGDYRDVIDYNAKLQKIHRAQYDITDPSRVVSKSKDYDRYGRLKFESRMYASSLDGDQIIPTETIYGMTFKYDTLGRALEKWDTAVPSEKSLYYYGQNWNNIKESSDPSVSFGYGVIDGRGYKRVIELESNGNPDDIIISEIYDQVRKSNEPNGSHYIHTSIDHDALINITAIQQGAYTRSYEYHSQYPKLVRHETHPEVGRIDYTYDTQGNIKTKTEGGSYQTSFGYDGLNQLILIDYPSDLSDITKGYYKHGELKFVENPISRWDYQYNDAKKLTNESLSTAGEEFTLAYDYNLLGHLASLTFPNGDAIDYAPNILGQPTRAGKFVNHVDYHANGYFKSIDFKNGHRMVFDINNYGFPARIRSGASSGNVLDKSYQYDSRGNVTSITDHVESNNSIVMNLDGVSRLTTATSNIWGGIGRISYDDNGNITSKQFGSTSTSYSYDQSKNLLANVSGGYSFSYDYRGNVIGNGKNTFFYNAAGNLSSVSSSPSIDYEYDGHNRRVLVSKTNSSMDVEYFSMYNLGGQLVYRYNPFSGEHTNYIYLGTKLIATDLDCRSNDLDLDSIPDCVEDAWGLDKNNKDDAYGDMDGDGVANIYEYAFELNPTSQYSFGNASTDAELITDNISRVYEDDMDGDGLSDQEEYLLGANPLNPDSDGDGLIDGIDSNPVFNFALLIPILHILN